MRISDWSSDVCSSDLEPRRAAQPLFGAAERDRDAVAARADPDRAVPCIRGRQQRGVGRGVALEYFARRREGAKRLRLPRSGFLFQRCGRSRLLKKWFYRPEPASSPLRVLARHNWPALAAFPQSLTRPLKKTTQTQ